MYLGDVAASRRTIGKPEFLRSLALFALVFVVLLAALDHWLYNNDPIFNLGTGYSIGGDDPDVRKFHEAANANCRNNASQRETVEACLGYQQVILENLAGNYPVSGLFGHLLQFDYGRADFLGQASRAAVAAAIAGSLTSALLFLVVLWQLSPISQLTLAAIIGVGCLIQNIARRPPLKIAAPAQVETFAAVVSLIAGILLVAGLSVLLKRWDERKGADGGGVAAWWTSRRPALIFLGLLLVLAIGRSVAPVGAASQLIALGLAALIFASSSAAARLPVAIAALMAVALFGLITDDSFIKIQVPRVQGFLVVAAIVAYVTVRPRGRWAWLMPGTLLFHVSSAGLTALAVFLVEAVLCLRRWRLSPLLGASLATFVPAALFATRGTANPLSSLSGLDLAAVTARLAASPSLLPGLVVAVLLLAIAGAALARRDDRWDGLARILLMLSGVAIATQIGFIIDQDPTTYYNGSFYVISVAHEYFAPALTFGGVAGIAALLAERIAARPAPAVGMPQARHLAWLMPTLAVLFLVIAKAPGGNVGDSVSSALKGPAMVFLGAEPSRWDRLAIAAGQNDDYYLNSVKAHNDPIAYFSMLKLKVRKAARQFDPSAMRIFVLEEGGPRLMTDRQ